MSGVNQVRRSHTLYLTSRTREFFETPESLHIEIPDNAIHLEDSVKQNIKISLLNFSFQCNWYEVNETNNSFTITIATTPYNFNIEPGNYPFINLAQIISNAQNVIKCRYDNFKNKFIFTNTTNSSMTLTFNNNSYEILGFNPSENNIVGSVIVSSETISPRQNTELYMRLNNLTMGDGNMNMTNFNSRILDPCMFLSIIPIQAEPFRMQHMNNTILGEATGVFVANEKLNMLDIEIVDKFGAPATFISDWDCILKVEVIDVVDDNLQQIKKINAEMRDTLSKMLQFKFIRNYQNL